MMQSRNVRLIFAREIRDQFRDRRTLFMMLILPLLLYPGMGVGMLQMTVLFSHQEREIVVLGNDHLPETPRLIDGNRFEKRFFSSSPDAGESLHLVLETAPDEEEADADTEKKDLLAQAHHLVELVRAKHRIDRWEASENETEAPPKLAQVEQNLATAFASFPADVVIYFPPGFDEFVREYLTQDRPDEGQVIDQSIRPIVVYNGADEGSQLAYRQTISVLEQYDRELTRLRAKNLNLPEAFIDPLFERRLQDGDRHHVEDTAQEEQHSANIWSRFFPTLLILMTLTGAFYPSIDLGAGEKERGTMETLLISPAARSEIVLGKFLTILLFSILTAIFNILSMGITAFYMISMAGESPALKMMNLTLPPFTSFIAMGVMVIPLAAMFSAMSLALATFAKSTKEGQYYLTPLMIVVMGLTVFCMSPGVELTPFNSVIPVVGLGLLLKNLILSPISDIDVFVYILPVLLTSIGYSLIALWWAIEQFHREEVLFRESERLDLKLWFQHLLREKEPLPTSGEAIIAFATIMIMQFLSFGLFQGLFSDPNVSKADAILQSLAVQQLAIIASPALFMGLMLTSSFRRTFRLHAPRLKWVAMGILLPIFLLPLSMTLQSYLHWFFPELPPRIKEILAPMSDPNLSLIKLVGVFALLPALCEELAFRGFILSGFSRNGRTGVAVVFSALLFGVMHMIPQQVFNAFLLGLVLGLLALRSGSLLPGVLFHFVNNALGVVSERIPQEFFAAETTSWFVKVNENGLSFSFILLLICSVGGGLCIRHLIVSGNDVSPALTEQVFPESVSETAEE
ncbi:MAG: CPBP family intramembrane metalloprotease [Planctomycetaceae bacterium]|nr:CPBP family intramembrane metalloprotease [Planctomycetaceae bacterium]